VQSLKSWWQRQTGEDDTPFDGDSGAFIVSLVFHCGLLVVLGLVPFLVRNPSVALTLAPAEEITEEETVELPKEVFFSETPATEVGANSMHDVEMALSLAPVVSDVSDIPNVVEPTSDVGQIEVNEAIQVATGLHAHDNLAVKGAAGEGTKGASGAVDRITHEILNSLEERKTLVVWLFDQSGSLTRQRQLIHDRFDRIYKELGVLEAAGNEAFTKHDDKPLLTSVVSFGQQINLLTQKPTDNLAEIKEAVQAIEQDTSGVENVFSAVYMVADKYKDQRVAMGRDTTPKRNVMLVVFSDEAGDDQVGLDKTVKMCRRYEMPVYVVGVPAPFGRRETLVKWVDPDPKFDQSPQWGEVVQGPESFMPERLKLHFAGGREDDTPIDSGFGPFALTRLSYETGGIYFAVHPNRNVTRQVSKREVDAYSAHIKHFFDPQIMRSYRPDYVSIDEYKRRVGQNKSRAALVTAAQNTWVAPMESPQLRFVKRDEASFSNALSEAQKASAKLTPRVQSLHATLKLGESDRDNEVSPRWQAGFDLAMGRILAVKVRTEAYNVLLAKAKRGLKPKDPKTNTWVLTASDDFTELGSSLEKEANKAKMYLERVITDHPNTPWALLAQRELDAKIGWVWSEDFTDLTPRRAGNGGGNGNGNPNNDAKNMIKRPPPKRKPPKL